MEAYQDLAVGSTRVTVTVRVRPPDKGSGKQEVGLFPTVDGGNTIIVDRDGSEAETRWIEPGGSSGKQSEAVRRPPAKSSAASGTTFTFDKVFWSMHAGSDGQERHGSVGRHPAPYASQKNVFEGIGRDTVDKCLAGFNTCLFAYGQTGSGKTFTMMGGTDPSAVEKSAAGDTGSGSPRTTADSLGPPIMGSGVASKTDCALTDAPVALQPADAKVAPKASLAQRNKNVVPTAEQRGQSALEANRDDQRSAELTKDRAWANVQTDDRPIMVSNITSRKRQASTKASNKLTSDSPPLSIKNSCGPDDRFAGDQQSMHCSAVDGDAGSATPPRPPAVGPETSVQVGGRVDRGVVPRICDYLFECAAAVAAEDNQSPKSVDSTLGTVAGKRGDSQENDVVRADCTAPDRVGISRAGVGNAKNVKAVSTSWSFSVSFTEIYMERVRDLLDTSDRSSQSLKVREHPITGPFVEGVLSSSVSTAAETEKLLIEGQARRVVAGTNMNEVSSRSHAIFTIMATKTAVDQETGAEGLTTSKVNLVDLAGSENSNTAGSVGTRLKEGSSINKSLLTLGRVIKALADASVEVHNRPTTHPPGPEQKVNPRRHPSGVGDETGVSALQVPPTSGSGNANNRSVLRPPSASSSSICTVASKGNLSRTGTDPAESETIVATASLTAGQPHSMSPSSSVQPTSSPVSPISSSPSSSRPTSPCASSSNRRSIALTCGSRSPAGRKNDRDSIGSAGTRLSNGSFGGIPGRIPYRYGQGDHWEGDESGGDNN